MIVEPVDWLEGKVRAPPSKSYTHRAFFLALLADGESTIEEPLVSDDTEATLNAIRAFGAEADWNRVVPPEELRKAEINARESGTTARISVAVASLARGRSVIDGQGRLRERPFAPLVRALRSLGVTVRGEKLPIEVFGGMPGGRVSVDASLSSQFVTALLILASKVGMRVEFEKAVSKPYIEMTLRTMEAFGVTFERNGGVRVFPGVKGTKFHVPGDYSSASFFLVAGALYGRVRVENLDPGDVQADMAIVEILGEIGANVKVGGDYVEVSRGELRGFEINCSDFPDLFPILSVLAAYAEGRSVIRGRQLRYKESDRVRAMAVNLARAGIKVRELEDGLEIHGGRPRGVVVEDFNDHRVAMAMAVLGLGARGKTVIKNERVVAKSYPGFFGDLRRLLG
ncbi:3-phosphoshikimate 1-carboxyvinyltransferase [Thermococcus gammatolerans]|uniref:3-phosphoshikimate 1-carboxyvinyltransferase n=1 Tax=Thermococcus gammatolerans (strain DSM 15229 / JCM 11827 / EJ3) TaxID=593117 RepID=C5A783_THEGJ|nr:3-phosphoshikimate 1-carboxyvinyltransferase [Thermococcus gammatolerans]ACS34095.1 3-phosphoshikimate 1-carboxyvinyltransferase (aroA) [Thermococcus gammatolerans EJ3]